MHPQYRTRPQILQVLIPDRDSRIEQWVDVLGIIGTVDPFDLSDVDLWAYRTTRLVPVPVFTKVRTTRVSMSSTAPRPDGADFKPMRLVGPRSTARCAMSSTVRPDGSGRMPITILQPRRNQRRMRRIVRQRLNTIVESPYDREDLAYKADRVTMRSLHITSDPGFGGRQVTPLDLS